MNEKFKNACDSIRMTPEQKQKIYLSAKHKIQKGPVKKSFFQAHPALSSGLCTLLLLSVFCLILFPGLNNTKRETAASLPAASESKEELSEQSYEYYLLLGSDARSPKDFPVSCADAIIIAQLEKNSGALRLMPVPQNLLLYDEHTETLEPVNRLYMNDNGSTVKNLGAFQETIGEQLNLSVKGSVIIGWNSLIHIIDAVGGLELDVTSEELQASITNGYITEIVNFTGIGSAQLSESGIQLLDGVQSLAWLRASYYTEKAGHQQRFVTLLNTLLDKLKSSSFSVLLDVITGMVWGSDDFATNLELTQITSMLEGNHNYRITDTLTLDQSLPSLYQPDGDNGNFLAVADWKEFHKLIQAFMNDQPSVENIDYDTLNSFYQQLLSEQ